MLQNVKNHCFNKFTEKLSGHSEFQIGGMRRSDSNIITFPSTIPLKPQAQRRNDLRFTNDNQSTKSSSKSSLNDIFGIQQWLWHKFVPTTGKGGWVAWLFHFMILCFLLSAKFR